MPRLLGLLVTEAEMLERCRAGQRDAQRELYARTVDRIHRLLLKMTNREEDAFDLAQETYVRAFAHVGRFDGRSSVQTWLYRIAINEALAFLRRAKAQRKTLSSLSADPTRREAATDETDARMDVGAALAALSPADRLLLLLRYEQGLDYRTMAEVVDCAEGTVASRLNRARQRLRELLEPSYGTREETDADTHPSERQVSATRPIAWQPPARSRRARGTGESP